MESLNSASLVDDTLISRSANGAPVVLSVEPNGNHRVLLEGDRSMQFGPVIAPPDGRYAALDAVTGENNAGWWKTSDTRTSDHQPAIHRQWNCDMMPYEEITIERALFGSWPKPEATQVNRSTQGKSERTVVLLGSRDSHTAQHQNVLEMGIVLVTVTY